MVFGKVVDGIDLIQRIGQKFGSEMGVPTADIYIGACGIST